MHEPESRGGLGMPYYGLVTEISDRYGNSIQYDYCGFHQWPCDDHRLLSDGGAYAEPTPCCRECCQNCNEKGQVSRIRLVAANGQTAWTLLYTYRSFGQLSRDWEVQWHGFGQHALHSIHVYEGLADLPTEVTCLTLGPEAFCGEEGNPTLDEQVQHPAIDQVEGGSDKLIMEVNYLYSSQRFWPGYPEARDPCPANWAYENALSADEWSDQYRLSAGRLVKATVTRWNHEDGTSAPPHRTMTMYRYEPTASPSDEISATNGGYRLQAVYENDTIAAMVKGREQRLGLSCIDPNFLFELPNWPNDPGDTEQLADFFDYGTGELSQKPLAELADVYLSASSSACSDGCHRSLIDDFIGSDLCRTKPLWYVGERYVRDDRSRSEHNGRYHLYYYAQYPQQLEGTSACEPPVSSNCEVEQNLDPSWIMFRYPYGSYCPFTGQIGHHEEGLYALPLDKPFFTIVIDKESESVRGLPYRVGGESLPPRGLDSRRVVELNPAGFLIRDRTWQYVDGALQQTQQSGQSEQFVYDVFGRLTEERSRGWDSQANQNQNTMGLIHIYEYDDYWDASTSSFYRGFLKAEGLKSGRNGMVYYTRCFERGVPKRPELITKEVVFASHVTDPNSALGAMTEITYTLKSGLPPEDAPIERKEVKRPSVAWSATESYRAVERVACDSRGNTAWVARGSEDGLNNVKEMYLEYAAYNDRGQPVTQIVDADTTLPPDGGWQMLPPAGWAREPAEDPPALRLTTTYEYDPTWGLVRTVLPNGRENRVAVVPNADGRSLRKWVLTDVSVKPGQVWTTLSPVRIQTIEGGKLTQEKEVSITSTDLEPDGLGTEAEEANQQVLSYATPQYDSHGRLVGMNRADAGGNPKVEVSVGYDSNGELNRVQGPDGTITRRVYDELGRLRGTYRGTDNIHEFWGTGILCADGENPEDTGCLDLDEFPDNMVLVEKRYYGSGTCESDCEQAVNSTDQLVKVRHFRAMPTNQYQLWDPDGQNPDPNAQPGWWVDGIAPNEDEIGWVTNIQYDWRMRPVWEQRCRASGPNGEDGEALTHTLTWYDNLDRPRLVAEYGSTAPVGGDADPREALEGSSIAAATILGASPAPIALTETIYNARGQAEEVRRYNVGVANGTSYTATRTYYNHRNQPVEVLSPDAPVQKYIYDAKGRQFRSSSWAGGAEMTRTETVYDWNDRATQTTYCERRHDLLPSGGSGELGDTDSVKSYTHTWYDQAGKVIATANYGTNNSEGVFASGPAPAYDADDPPVQYDEGSQVSGIVVDALPSGTLLTGYAYDAAGNQSAAFHPDGTVTRSEYDDLGRLVLTTENADDFDHPELIQRTAYDYDDSGRLVRIKAVLPTDAGGQTPQQITELEYGADVVNSGGAPISANNSFIKKVHFPSRATSQPSEDDVLTFTYYSDGSVATRTDQRGIKFTHHYDELGRRVETLIDDSAWYVTPPAGQGQTLPPNRIHRLVYEYLDNGSLSEVAAWRHWDGSMGTLLAQNQFDYDVRGNLTAERQRHGDVLPVGSTVPVVGYTWAYSPAGADNYDRLASITYPARIDGSSHSVSFSYGSDGSVGSGMGRVGSISVPELGAPPVATYQYAGASRRVATQWGNGTSQSFAGADPSGGYPGLDRYGRVKDLHFKDGSDGTIHRYQYGHGYGAGCGCQAAGNLLYVRVEQAPDLGGTPHVNDRSCLYAYDPLNRLTGVQMGELTADNQGIVIGEDSPIRRTAAWGLDNLGNWSGMGNNPGVIRTGDFDGDGVADPTRYLHHGVNGANEVTAISEYAEGETPMPPATPIVSDPAGNQVADGTYYLQYDAWNRLVQVNLIGTAMIAQETTTEHKMGQIISGQLGDLICRYAYDAMGRLMWKQTPINVGLTQLQRKDYYYDGVRRIQEVISRPRQIIEEIPEEALDLGTGEGNDESPVQMRGGSPPPQEIDPEPVPTPTVNEQWTDREYVYGPGYVDEFILQIDRLGRAMYMLQDPNYNVVAILTGPNDPGGLPAGTILEQYAYDPYGTAVAADNLDEGGVGAHAINRVGFQGLFFERYDGSYTLPSIAPNVAGMYYARNRFYTPALGRFLQRDPNETGIPIITALAMNGEAVAILFGGFDISGLYGDGMNLYLFARANPNNNLDPAGLFTFLETGIVLGERGYVETMDAAAAAKGWIFAKKLIAGIVLALALAQTAQFAIMDSIENGRDDCYCMCIKPDPWNPGQNTGPEPIGRMKRSCCKNWPYTGGAGKGYKYCYCKGDP